MNNIQGKILIILLLANMFVPDLSAQNKKDTLQKDDPYKELYQKQKEIDELTKKLSSLETKLSELQDDNELLKGDIKVKDIELSANSKTIDSLNKQLAKLEKSEEELNKLKNASSKKQLDELNKLLKQKSDSIVSLSNQISDFVESIEKKVQDLEKNNKQLTENFKPFVSQMADAVDNTWYPRVFSSMTLAELTAACENYKKMSSIDPKIVEASKKMNALLTDFKTYQMGVNFVNSTYNNATKDAVYKSIDKLYRNCDSKFKAKKDELYDLAYNINNYSSYTKDLQTHIHEIDEALKIKNKHITPNKIEEYLNKPEVKNSLDEIKSSIPYLANIWQEYYNTLQANLKAGKFTISTPAHDAIMSLIP